jgi:uncharacterized protein (TIGR02246 family)
MTTDERAIRNLSRDFVAAVRAKNLEAILDMVTDDAIFLPPGTPEVRGKQAVAEMYGGFFARFAVVEQTAALEEVKVSGEWAFAWGTDEILATPASGGPAMRTRGKSMIVLQRGTDGAWRFARGINNMMPEAVTVH